jgi:hypothetical protein
MANIAALTQSTSWTKNRGTAPQRCCHPRSTVTTQTLQARANPMTRATGADSGGSIASGTTMRITVIVTQTARFASTKGQFDRAGTARYTSSDVRKPPCLAL